MCVSLWICWCDIDLSADVCNSTDILVTLNLSADVCKSAHMSWCDTDLSADVYESTDMLV